MLLTKELLANEYLSNNKSIKKIAQECNVSYTTIRYWLIKFSISIRSKREAKKGREYSEEHKNNISMGRKEFLKDKTKHPRWNGGPIETICETCGKKFLIEKYKHTKGIRRFCSKDCYTVYQQQNIVEISLKTREKMSESRKKYIEKNGCYFTGKKHDLETIELISRNRTGKCMGEEHPHWNNGSSFEPYGIEFNDELREQIRERDGYVCQNQECEITQEELGYVLSVHHIDYDKKNNEETNLISLCNSCHAYTNYDRDVWKIYFENIIGGIKNYAGPEVLKKEGIYRGRGKGLVEPV